MANNGWNEVLAEINSAISESGRAAQAANAAAANADEQAGKASEAAQASNAAAQAANTAAQEAQSEAAAWNAAKATAETIDYGDTPRVTITEEDGEKKLHYKIPAGRPGEKGDPGADGRSGVTFELVGTKLYITTEG